MSDPVLNASGSQSISHVSTRRSDNSLCSRIARYLAPILSCFGRSIRVVDESAPAKLPRSYTCLRSRELRYEQEPDSTKALWSQLHHSPNIIINQDSRSLFRRPTLQLTDLALSELHVTQGIHIFEILWPKQMRGTHAVLGVAMADSLKQSVGYVSLLGMDHKSWGWDITRNKLLHNNSLAVTYPKGSIDYVAPDRIRCILNMDTGVLGFETEGNYLGDAFTDLKGKQLHIAVSTVFGRAQIGIQYISGIDRPEPLALQKITKRAIRDTLHDVKQVSLLPLPRSLRAFLLNE